MAPSASALDRLDALIRSAEGRVPEPPASLHPVRASTVDYLGSASRVQLVAEAERLGFSHAFNPAFATEAALIDPLPHQRIAVYDRMLPQSRLRFLLADDPGAGKTIMAGLLLRELLARKLLRRVLIAPPAGLVGNWARELRSLFDLRFRIVRGTDIRSGNPFAGERGSLVICSIDTLAQETSLARLAQPDVEGYDIVVFDEAHKLSATRESNGHLRSTIRYALAEQLAGATDDPNDLRLPWSARHVLLLTATPHMGKDDPWWALWRLLDRDVFSGPEALAMLDTQARGRWFLRRTKEEMVDFRGARLYPQRESRTILFDLGTGPDSERELYDRTTEYLRTAYGRMALANPAAARLALGVFQRRLASSTFALLQSLERRRERLAEAIDNLASGRLSVQQHATVQRALAERLVDPFARTADEEEADGNRESHEADEDEAVSLLALAESQLREERQELAGLLDLARRVSTLADDAKFRRLREFLTDPRSAREKLIVFTEHRDTLAWLQARLEALGYTGRIAAVHGGMDFRERDAEVERFRMPAEKGGAQYLLATDAAGEGINLQFCWQMVNYDIPWNPARLEQRMGRIHRYGQKHDPVVIVNLVARGTREDRVLHVLLDKLDAIRRELSSDKVFDVVGRILPQSSIADAMAADLFGDQSPALESLRGLSADSVQAVTKQEQARLGDQAEVRRELPRLRDDLQAEILRRLLPGYVRRFIERACPELDLVVDGDLQSVFALRSTRPAALATIADALEEHDPDVRNRLTVMRPSPADNVIYLRPGERVFDRLRQLVLTEFAPDAARGAVFEDPDASDPYFLRLAELTLARDEPGAATPAVEECSLLAVRQRPGGHPELCPVEHLLTLHGLAGFPVSHAPLVPLAAAADTTMEAWVESVHAPARLREVRGRIERAIPERQASLVAGFDHEEADLAARRARLAGQLASGKGKAAEELGRVKELQRSLPERRQATLDALAAAPDRIRVGAIRWIARCLVVPAAGDDARREQEVQVERIAMDVARAWEETQGARVIDVSTPDRAHRAGLGSSPGFDLLAVRPDGSRRCIEVKGRTATGAVEITENEWARACNLRDQYWLHVVFDCASPQPRLHAVQDPFARLIARAKGSLLLKPAEITACSDAVWQAPLPAGLPSAVRELLWDHDPDRVTWPADRDLIVARVLQSGGDEAVRWLREQLGDERLSTWLVDRDGRGLDVRRLRYWQLVLDLPPAMVDGWVAAQAGNPWSLRAP